MSVQEFTTTDVLRLEVEEEAAGPVNLVPNRDGALGGWGWLTLDPATIEGRKVTTGDGSKQVLHYVAPGGGAQSEFRTESLEVTPGDWVAAWWLAPFGSGASGTHRATFHYLDADGEEFASIPQTAAYPLHNSTIRTIPAVQVPPGATHVRFYVATYSDVAGVTNPALPIRTNVTDVVVATAATAAELANLGLVSEVPYVDVLGPTHEIKVTREELNLGTLTATILDADLDPASAEGIRPGRRVRLSCLDGVDWLQLFAGKVRHVSVEYDLRRYRTPGVPNVVFTNGCPNPQPASATGWAAPGLAVVAAPWGGGRTVGRCNPAAVGTPYLFSAADPRAYAAGETVTVSASVQIPAGKQYHFGAGRSDTNTYFPALAYTRIGTGAKERVSMTVVLPAAVPAGQLQARVVGFDADFAPGDYFYMGDVMIEKAGEPSAFFDGGTADDATWTYAWTGAANASTSTKTRTPIPPNRKRARISLTAVDNGTPLAKVGRAEGVATIDELPYVLEGAGVPWNINGSGAQIPGADVIAVNPNATALDQVAITRDSNLGHAWVDRLGVLQVWDAAEVSTDVQATLDETAYSDLSIDYDTDRCINHVTVKLVRTSPDTGETEELTFGPYLDQESINLWDVHAAEFTVQWADADPAAVEAYAEQILAANATPVVRINSITLPIRTTDDFTDTVGAKRAILDLHDLVTASNDDADVSEDLRVTRLEHTITPDAWKLVVGFAVEGGVAPPQVTPSPPVSSSTWWPEVRMFYGAPGEQPANWLVMDGSAFDADEYPLLADHLGVAVLPNFTDVFPIGAGTKALGTSGGNPTKVIAAANLPPHAHTIAHTHDMTHTHQIARATDDGTHATNVKRGGATAAGAAATGASSQANTGAASNGNSGNGPGTSTPLDVMNPWRAIYFIIRGR